MAKLERQNYSIVKTILYSIRTLELSGGNARIVYTELTDNITNYFIRL